jgi:AraC family transcriptional regulator of adaptative response/methylated-DNA-[protein]-cysteine methyltransferase
MTTKSKDYSDIPFFDEPSVITKTTKADKNTLVISLITSPFGDLLAGATDNGICLLEFTDTNRIEMQISRLEKGYQVTVKTGSSFLFDLLNQQLQDYFSGKLKDFSIPLDTIGTDFQKQVWNALLTIPYGETRSYQQQAETINKPKAVRAVANANRNNKISILIPCHRVIGKNGTMTGYGGGIWRKQYLLDLEAGKPRYR